MQRSEPSHYATLGLDRECTLAEIRAAYRWLAKQHHPDLNPGSAKALANIQQLNAAYQILSEPKRRLAYDRELEDGKKLVAPQRAGRGQPIIFREVNLRIEEFLRGTKREIRVNDPSNLEGPEVYALVVPPATAPGARFRLPRHGSGAGGWLQLRLRVLPDFRFKVRGSDLKYELRIKAERATQGGLEMVRGATGAPFRVEIPRGVHRGQVLRVAGGGLPKLRGGWGDLLVRINYQPKVHISRPERQ